MKRLLVLILIISSVVITPAQTKGTGPEETSVKKELRLRKQLRKESKERRRLERAERKKVKKHHKRIQTKKVRKRMKESKATATRNNLNKREFFVKRWFKKRGRAHVKSGKKD